LAADEAGFSRIAHGQYAFLLPCDESRVSNISKRFKRFKRFKLFKTKKNKPKIKKGATAVVKELSQYVFVSESQNYKVNFTMFITIKAVRNSCVLTM
jgi:nickel-dependent lactate racemase